MQSEGPQSSRVLFSAALEAEERKLFTIADALADKAIKLSLCSKSSDRISHAAMLVELADLCADNRRYEKSEVLYRQAVSIFEAIFGPDHICTLLATRNLAEVMDTLGREADAHSLRTDTKSKMTRRCS